MSENKITQPCGHCRAGRHHPGNPAYFYSTFSTPPIGRVYCKCWCSDTERQEELYAMEAEPEVPDNDLRSLIEIELRRLEGPKPEIHWWEFRRKLWGQGVEDALQVYADNLRWALERTARSSAPHIPQT